MILNDWEIKMETYGFPYVHAYQLRSRFVPVLYN
jgi:hypothetical protein